MKIPKCKYCNNLCKKRRPGYTKTCCSKKCISQTSKDYKHTEKTKEKLRLKRFEYLSKQTGKTAWERRNNGEMSYLEKWFYDSIIKHNLQKKYDIIYDYSVYPYFIDFAFLNIKLAVELDGKCHFINGKERVEHDQIKDNYLIKNDWIVYRIKYDEISDITISKFIDFLTNILLVEKKVYGNQLYKYFEIKPKKQKRTLKEYFIEVNKKSLEKNIPLIDKVLQSNIDFSKFGWVKKVSNIINIQHGKVHFWMKKYMMDFYNEKCFKRKIHSSVM